VAILRSLIEAVSNKRHVNVTASSGGVLIKKADFDIVHQCGATASLQISFDDGKSHGNPSRPPRRGDRVMNRRDGAWRPGWRHHSVGRRTSRQVSGQRETTGDSPLVVAIVDRAGT
jgi:hypothetical protein